MASRRRAVGAGRQQTAWARWKYQEHIEEGISAESIWKDLKGKIYLGVDDFVEEMRGKLDGGDEDVNIPRVQQTSTGIQTEHILRQYKIRMTQYGRRTTLELTVTADCSEFGVHFITSGTIVRETVCSQ